MKKWYMRVAVDFWANPKIMQAIAAAGDGPFVAILAQQLIALNADGNRDGALTARDMALGPLAWRLSSVRTDEPFSESDVERYLELLTEVQFIDRDPDGGARLVGWDDEWRGSEPKTGAQRQRDYRDRQRSKEAVAKKGTSNGVTEGDVSASQYVTPQRHTGNAKVTPRGEERRGEVPERAHARDGVSSAEPESEPRPEDLEAEARCTIADALEAAGIADRPSDGFRRQNLARKLHALGYGPEVVPRLLGRAARSSDNPQALVAHWIAKDMTRDVLADAELRDRERAEPAEDRGGDPKGIDQILEGGGFGEQAKAAGGGG